MGKYTQGWISVFTYIMWELIRHQPCNELSHHLSLVIYSLNRDKNLPSANKGWFRKDSNKHNPYQKTTFIILIWNPPQKNTFLRHRDVITKFIHSTVRRLHSWIVWTWHFPVRAKVEKRKHMQRASSMSRRASTKDGYLPQGRKVSWSWGTRWKDRKRGSEFGSVSEQSLFFKKKRSRAFSC